jgi:hypothetical protein
MEKGRLTFSGLNGILASVPEVIFDIVFNAVAT